MTAPPPITPTSPRCPSAWQPNPGRRSTYRRGKAVQTTGTTSQNHIDINVNNQFGLGPTSPTALDNFQWGGTVGAGVEQALTPAFSLKLEYQYLAFAGSNIATSPSIFFPPPRLTVGSTASVTEQFNLVKLGLNYKVGVDPNELWAPVLASYPVKATPTQAWAPAWQFEGGARYWYSSGRFQKDLPATNNDQSLLSRLTYANLSGKTGEFFGRLDSAWNIFMKGNVGGGGTSGGHMNDEDWGLFPVSYSNTISENVSGLLFYGTIDLGYEVLRGPSYKVGPFVGYNRYRYTMNAGGCAQIANQFSDCVGANAEPVSHIGITEDDTWDSLRVGTAGEAMLFDRWLISADVAYLPYVKFVGVDYHLDRALTFDEAGDGTGVQVEAFLSYFITDQFSVGVGGRYWAMWATSGTDTVLGIVSPRNDTYSTERVGVTLQASYKFGVPGQWMIASKN